MLLIQIALIFYDKEGQTTRQGKFSNAEGADFNTIQKQIKERTSHRMDLSFLYIFLLIFSH